MSIQVVSDISTLRGITGSSNDIADVLGYYAPGDGGGGEFYWHATSTTADNGGTVIKATATATGRWIRLVEDKINAKWFGAKGDGSTDDSTAVKNSLSLINSGVAKSVMFPDGTYLITDTAQTSISNQSDFTIEMHENAKFVNTDFTSFLTASATFSSTTATITTSTAHGYSTGNSIAMSDFSDAAYNGYYSITVTGSTTFTYTLIYTPAGSALSGKVRPINISNTLLTLSNCSNANVSFNFHGTVQHISIQSRVGWVGLKLQNACSNITANLKGSGLAYMVWSGDYMTDNGNLTNANISVNVKNVGYPVALWKSGHNSIFNVAAENVHRGTYAAAVKNSTFNMLVKNYDITGILITILHLDASTVFASENLKVNITDFGSDLTLPTPRSAQTVAILGYDVNAACEIKNLDIDIQSNNAKFVTSLLMRTYNTLHKISNVNVKALIDRSSLSDSDLSAEMILGGEVSSGVSGTYSGINFLSWRVYNPATVTKYLSIDLRKLTDDINFVDLYSTSPRYISVPTGRRVLYTQPIISGDTASRPTLTSYSRGFEYFDTDFNRPVWWNGTAWVDSSVESLALATASASYTTDVTYISANTTSGDQVVTLPSVSSCKGKRFLIIKTDSSANIVTVTPVSSQKIGYSDNIILRSQWAYVEIVSNGSVWLMTGYSNNVFTTNTTDVVTTSFLNTNYPIASYPMGTVVYYYSQNKKFERISSIHWVSIATVAP